MRKRFCRSMLRGWVSRSTMPSWRNTSSTRRKRRKWNGESSIPCVEKAKVIATQIQSPDRFNLNAQPVGPLLVLVRVVQIRAAGGTGVGAGDGRDEADRQRDAGL